MIKEIKPIKEGTQDYELIEREIIALFKDEIYLPLMDIIGGDKQLLKNSLEDVIGAIGSGKIYFYRGHFKGRFNSTLSRELKRLGAKWDRTHGSWRVPLGSLPTDLRLAISLSETKWSGIAEKIDERLAQILPAKIAEKLKIDRLFDSTLFKVDKSLQKTLEGITVVPKLTKDQRHKIAKEYTENMRLYIVDWTEKEILQLREKVQKRSMRGLRYEDLAKIIKKSYGVSQSKATFLARQETSLMMTKFKETRYVDAGVTKYKWGCVAGSALHPVRPMHKALEGKIFTWDNPPITDDKGNRNNPGQDYNCRCYARPIVEF